MALLQYADDTILCIQDDLEMAQNLKWLLYLYESMSGLKINFNKSEVIMINQNHNKSMTYSEMFNCAIGEWPIKYLGVPVSGSKLHVGDWTSLVEKVSKRLDGWKGGSLSLGGRLTLLNSCLTGIPIYSMSMYRLPKTVIKKIDIIRKRFFWQGSGMKKKYHLVKWEKICKTKQKGGLGVKDLRKMNTSLLCKWWWNLECGQGLWHDICWEKYLKNTCVTMLKEKPFNSPVWNDLLKVKDIYTKNRKIIVGKGDRTDLWHDVWCADITVSEKFPGLFDICNEKEITVDQMARKGWRFTFRRWLDERLQNDLRTLRDILTSFAVNEEADYPRWVWEKSGRFSVKSTYNKLCSNESGVPYTMIWKAKIPLKIKIWMWLIEHNAILTKDNLSRRNWVGDSKCAFCNGDETILHLFFGCDMAKYVWSLVAFVIGADNRPSSFDQYWVWIDRRLGTRKQFFMVGLAAICWAIWKARNAFCFEKKLTRLPTEIICSVSSFVTYWAGLHKEDDKKELEQGAEALMKTALQFHPQTQGEDAGVVLLQ